MSSYPRLGSRGLASLSETMTPVGEAIVRQVAVLRLMSAGQIAAVHFPAGNGRSAGALTRACNRELARLNRERLLVRLGRRLGGLRAGSSAYLYCLGPVGHRLLAANGPRPRFREPSALFVDHTLAVSQLVVDLTLAERRGQCELLGVQAEPQCWRSFGGVMGRVVLRPDLYVQLGVGDFELRFFCEIDRATEHLPAIVRKCHAYEAYYRSGREQAEHGVFPRVFWVVPDEARAEQLESALERARLTTGLFHITTSTEAVDTFTRRPE